MILTIHNLPSEKDFLAQGIHPETAKIWSKSIAEIVEFAYDLEEALTDIKSNLKSVNIIVDKFIGDSIVDSSETEYENYPDW